MAQDAPETVPAGQEQTAQTTAAAREFFQQGLVHAEAGEWELAADRFRRSLRLRSSPVVAFNLGTAYRALGRLVEATELFRQVAREASGELAEAAAAGLEELTPQLGRLTVILRGPAEDVDVQIDGRPVPRAAIGAPLPADPGERRVEVLRGGERLAELRPTVSPGAGTQVDFVIPPPAPEAVAAAAAPPLEPELGPLDRGEAEGGGDDGLVIGLAVAGAIMAVAAVALGLGIGLSQQRPEAVAGDLMPGTLEFE